MTWNPAYWLVSHRSKESSSSWIVVTSDELVDDDEVFFHFQQALAEPKGHTHLTAIARQMEILWDSIDWQASDPDGIFQRQRAMELWVALWRNEFRLTGSPSRSGDCGQFYQQLRHRLESRWEWNTWVSRYLHMTRHPSLWHEDACRHLFRRIQSCGPHRPYALTLCWKILLSHHAPSRHYPVSHAVREYVQGLSPHLSWATLSDYYVKRFLDWEKNVASRR